MAVCSTEALPEWAEYRDEVASRSPCDATALVWRVATQRAAQKTMESRAIDGLGSTSEGLSVFSRRHCEWLVKGYCEWLIKAAMVYLMVGSTWVTVVCLRCAPELPTQAAPLSQQDRAWNSSDFSCPLCFRAISSAHECFLSVLSSRRRRLISFEHFEKIEDLRGCRLRRALFRCCVGPIIAPEASKR